MQGGTQERLFETRKVEGEVFYNTLSSVSCPYFREQVFFTSAGLEHLRFKQRGKPRNTADQSMRFKLLPLGVRIIEKSSTLQGMWETKSFEKIRIHKRVETVLKQVIYYEFIAVMSNMRLRVIIKRIEGGPLYFWSIIPYWKRNKDSTKKLYSGRLDQD